MFMPCLSPQEITRIRWILSGFFVFWIGLALAPHWLAHRPWFYVFNVAVHVNSTRMVILFDVMIFVLAWNTYGSSRTLTSVTMALTFLFVAGLDFLYLSRLPGMLTFLPRSHPDAAMVFWLLARLVTAGGVALACLVPAPRILKERTVRCMLALAWLMMIGAGVLVLGGGVALPELPDTAWHWPAMVTLSTRALALASVLLVIFSMTRRPAKCHAAGAPVRSDMLLACIALALSEFPYPAMQGLHGPAFRLIATVFFYRAVLIGSIKAPYATMAQLTHRLRAASNALRRSESRLSGIIQNALDAIITMDDANKIVLTNPAAAAMFGTTLEAMRGTPIETWIPLRHRKGFQGYIRNFSKVRISFFKMGSSYADYDVTGLRANGDEFPLEASISVMVEGECRFTILILRDISERKKAQEELSRSHAELHRLSIALQSGRENERKHVAQDLHDDLGQLLAALRIDLSLLQQQAQQASLVKPTQLENMDDLLTTSIKSLRRIASDLRPRALDEGGLYFALQSLRKEFESRHGIACHLIAEEDALILDDARTTTLYRIVQEALANVLRHAGAREVIIEFRRCDGHLELHIDDDGRGIRTDDFLNPAGFGLVDMRERIKAMHGELCITGEPQLGTRIDIKLPLQTSPWENPA
jgi:PAS domain S-box-containing protein